MTLAAAGCGESASSKQAKAIAQEACGRLLTLGQAMERHTPTAGSAIDKQLRTSQTNLDRATQLDHDRWAGLDGAVHGFVTNLEGGLTPSRDQVVGITNGCAPFTPGPATSST